MKGRLNRWNAHPGKWSLSSHRKGDTNGPAFTEELEIDAKSHWVQRRGSSELLEAEDQIFRVKMLWSELHGAGCLRSDRRVDLVEMAAGRALCTDSRGGYDAVELKESPLLGQSNIRGLAVSFVGWPLTTTLLTASPKSELNLEKV